MVHLAQTQLCLSSRGGARVWTSGSCSCRDHRERGKESPHIHTYVATAYMGRSPTEQVDGAIRHKKRWMKGRHPIGCWIGSTSRSLPADWLFMREQCWYLYRERRLVLSALGSIQNLTWGTGMHGIAETNTSRFNLFLTFPPGILRAVFSSLLRSPFYKLPDHRDHGEVTGGGVGLLGKWRPTTHQLSND